MALLGEVEERGVDMENMEANPFDREKLSEEVLKEWQSLLDDAADNLGVPAGLITRVDNKTIEVLISSQTEGNPCTQRDRHGE